MFDSTSEATLTLMLCGLHDYLLAVCMMTKNPLEVNDSQEQDTTGTIY